MGKKFEVAGKALATKALEALQRYSPSIVEIRCTGSSREYLMRQTQARINTVKGIISASDG